MKFSSNTLRKFCRLLHRDLSYLFSGMLIIYAVSGIVMNHKGSINPNYSVERREIVLDNVPAKQQITKQWVMALLADYDLKDKYTKHYFPAQHQLKVFIKGGSVLELDIESGRGVLEVLSLRIVIGSMAKLHYNPGLWWTCFADIFGVSLILIVLSGIFMNKGRNGIIGRGGIELIIGILIPLSFLLLF